MAPQTKIADLGDNAPATTRNDEAEWEARLDDALAKPPSPRLAERLRQADKEDAWLFPIAMQHLYSDGVTANKK